LSSNTFAAFASGSFALAENYIYTTEAFKDYWEALSDSGYMMMEHQFYASRLVSECLDALREMDVDAPASHIAVYNLPTLKRKIILLSKAPLNQDIVMNAFGPPTPEQLKFICPLFPPMESNAGNLYHTIVQTGWRSIADTAVVDISPCTDDRPFIAQMGRMRNFSLAAPAKIPTFEISGYPLSKIVVLAILAVCIVIILPLNLIPFMRKGDKMKALPWLYFFAIGMGYMMIEVVLIQQYSLFIGSTIYSLALVLGVLLIASGIGSRYSLRCPVKLVFLGIVCWLLADIFIFRQMFYLLEGLPLIGRLAVGALLIAPMGFLMGMPFPKAASTIPQFVDWAFAVNGSASVIGSAAIILVASSFGYSVALGIAMATYGLAYMLYSMGRMGVDRIT
jgi:hypothetical protein